MDDGFAVWTAMLYILAAFHTEWNQTTRPDPGLKKYHVHFHINLIHLKSDEYDSLHKKAKTCTDDPHHSAMNIFKLCYHIPVAKFTFNPPRGGSQTCWNNYLIYKYTEKEVILMKMNNNIIFIYIITYNTDASCAF